MKRTNFHQTAGPPTGPPDPPEPPRVAPDPRQGGVGLGLLSALIVLAIFIAGAGFFGHMFVDLFSWAWELWADLVG